MALRLIILFLAPALWAATPKTHVWSNFKEFSKGELQGVSLTSSGKLQSGYLVKTWTRDLPNLVSHTVVYKPGVVYVATSNPGQIWEVKQAQKPRLVFELRQPIITGLFKMPNEELAIISTPKGGITYVRPGIWTRPRSVPIPGMILGAFQSEGDLTLVGDMTQKYEVFGKTITKKPFIKAMGPLRSVYKDFYGSSNSGIVYHKSKPVLSASGEVVALTQDDAGNLYAAFNISKNSSQIWKRSKDNKTCLVWESKSEIIYSLQAHRKKIYWGTGPNGHVFQSASKCHAGANIILSLPKHERMMSLDFDGNQLLVAAAQSGAVYSVDLDQKTSVSFFKTPVFKMPAPSKILKTSQPLWLGNTPERDENWWVFDSDKPQEAQYAQAGAVVLPGKSLDRIYFSYQFVEKDPRVASVLIKQPKKNLLTVNIEMEPKVSSAEQAYQFELQPLEGENIVLKPYEKVLSISHDTSKVVKGHYRVAIKSDKDKKEPAGYSDWFEIK